MNPDVILFNEFDYDAAGTAIASFQSNYLGVSQGGQTPVTYEHVFLAPSNTGIASGFDFNNDGSIGGGNDAYGFGNFEGQFGMVLLSKFPITGSRTFQEFLWNDMPGNIIPDADDPQTPEADTWFTPDELNAFRLSSKSHWDITVDVNGIPVHALAAHPTPPVFDGPEDLNGRRNHDEIKFWTDYVDGAGYITDDDGLSGGLAPDDRFVILGDYNADPFDGDSTGDVALQLLNHPKINGSPLSCPTSLGGPDAGARTGGINSSHTGSHALDTGDFNDSGPGNLRVDYVLPSINMAIEDQGVFWPEDEDPLFKLVGDFDFDLFSMGFPTGFFSSDHRLVFADVTVPEPTSMITLCVVAASLLTTRSKRRG